MGTSVVLVEVAVTLRLPAEVWASFTVNGMSPVWLLAAMVRLAMSVMVGGVFSGGGGLVAPPWLKRPVMSPAVRAQP